MIYEDILHVFLCVLSYVYYVQLKWNGTSGTEGS